jgi:hypothetical protein
MNKSRPWGTLCLVVLVPLLGGLAGAFSLGPPTGSTGVPGEGTCADPGCHTTFAVNSGSGGLVLTNVTSTPGQYEPGDTLDFGILLQQAGQSRWGFQLTVIDAAGHPAGTILVSDPVRTQVETGAGGRQYLTHTAPGTDSGTVDASPGWNFKWKAPAAGAGPVALYVAGNAADGDGTSLNDYVYTMSASFTELPASVHQSGSALPGRWHLGPNYPNPFNAGTRIHYFLDGTAMGPVSLTIYDLAGRRVRSLISGSFVGPGDHWVDWNGSDDRGLVAPSGTYLVALQSRAGSTSHKVSLIR